MSRTSSTTALMSDNDSDSASDDEDANMKAKAVMCCNVCIIR